MIIDNNNDNDDSYLDSDIPDPAPVSLGRSLGGLFGLGAAPVEPPPAGGVRAVRASQMRAAVCGVKVLWALQLADLGLVAGAGAYAREAKGVLSAAKLGEWRD